MNIRIRNNNMTRSAKGVEAANITEESILKVDILLSSPSTAAAFVSGYSASHNDMWKDQNGKSLREIVIIKNELIN